MKIKFSRHAKRRMRLYEIFEKDVIDIIKAYIANVGFVSGKKEIVNREISQKYGYPLKIVFSKENDKITVVTAYPLRKGYKK